MSAAFGHAVPVILYVSATAVFVNLNTTIFLRLPAPDLQSKGMSATDASVCVSAIFVYLYENVTITPNSPTPEPVCPAAVIVVVLHVGFVAATALFMLSQSTPSISATSGMYVASASVSLVFAEVYRIATIALRLVVPDRLL
jgi:hypothetical protein